MRLEAALDDALATRGHIRLLRALDLAPPGLDLSVRDLARRAGIAHNRASEVLVDLTEMGITVVRRAGRADLYRLSPDHVLYPVLRELFRRERAVGDELRRLLRQRLVRLRRIREAYIFGSVARAQETVTSDLDLAIVIPPSGPNAEERARIDEIAAEVRRRFGARLSVQVSGRSISHRAARGPGRDLWKRIADEGIPILGRPAKRAS